MNWRRPIGAPSAHERVVDAQFVINRRGVRHEGTHQRGVCPHAVSIVGVIHGLCPYKGMKISIRVSPPPRVPEVVEIPFYSYAAGSFSRERGESRSRYVAHQNEQNCNDLLQYSRQVYDYNYDKTIEFDTCWPNMKPVLDGSATCASSFVMQSVTCVTDSPGNHDQEAISHCTKPSSSRRSTYGSACSFAMPNAFAGSSRIPKSVAAQ